MISSCPSLQDLIALPDEGAGDPRWGHVRSCPRCRARMAAYGHFRSGSTVDRQPDEDAAVERLLHFIEEWIVREPVGRQGRSTSRPGAGPQRAAGAMADRVRRFLSTTAAPAFQRPRLIPILGVMAILAGGILLLHGEGSWRSTPERVLREQSVSPLAEGLVLSPPRLLSDGGVELRWSPHRAADSYQVTLLDKGYREVVRFDLRSDTTLVLGLESLRRFPAAFFWQVHALSLGDPVVDAVPGVLPKEQIDR